VIMIDLVLEMKKSAFRTPVLAVAVGIYLPFELSVPILFGGLLSFAAKRAMRGRSKEAQGKAEQTGLLFAAGLITGEALVGILLAIPVAAGVSEVIESGSGELAWPGIILLFAVMAVLFAVARNRDNGNTGGADAA
ncbi:MAG: OPT/YSL family transporter, partial [Phycisphaerales bacterium JB038]